MADKPSVKPSSAGVWIGLVMMLLSIVSCGAGCVLAASEVSDAADSATRVPVPASQTYEFEADAAGIIVGFAKTAGDAGDINATLTGPDGENVKIESSSSFSSSSSSSDGDSVEVVGAFEAKAAGTYTLTADGPTGSEVAILNISFSSILTKFFGGIGLGFVLFVVGLILAIVTGVRRSRAKKKAAAVGSFGAPPPGGGYPGQVPPAPGAPGMAPPPGVAPPAPQGYPQQAPPPAPGGYPPAAPPAPGGYQPPPTDAPYTPPPAPPAPPAPSAPPPPPPGQWGNDTPPPAPPFGS